MNTHTPTAPSASLTIVPPNTGDSWWVITNHQEIKLTSRDTRGALALWMETIPPGGGPPPHTHFGEDEIFVVTEGEVTFYSGDQQWKGTAGTVVFAPRGIPHWYKNTGKTNARMTFVVTPGGFENFFRDIAYHSANRETRPPVEKAEYEQLVKAAAKYDLVFHVGDAHA